MQVHHPRIHQTVAPVAYRPLLVALVVLLASSALRPVIEPPSSGPPAGLLDFGRLPLSFVPNARETDPDVRFVVRGLGGTLFFTPGEVVLAVPSSRSEVPAPELGTANATAPSAILHLESSLLRLVFERASPAAELVPAGRLPGVVNYYLGNDPAQWRTGVPTYAGVVYRQLYPGIDLHYDGLTGSLKGTYTIAPGADLAAIRWRYEGARSVRVDEATGDLVIGLPPTRPDPANPEQTSPPVPLSIAWRAGALWARG